MSHVEIKDGAYRGNIVNGIFEIDKPYSDKGFITVLGAWEENVHHSCRVKVRDESQLRYCDADGNDMAAPVAVASNGEKVAMSDTEAQYRALESEEEAMERIARAFEIQSELTVAVKDGIVRAMIVSGAPGIGKSYGTEQALKDGSLLNQIGPDGKYEIIKGNITPIQLYQALYRHRDADNVIVFDDCDAVLEDPISLNLLKAVLDTGETRDVSWLAESAALRAADVPDRFSFNGGIIFLSNLDFDNVRSSSKIGRHLEALRSRVLYLDLEVSNMDDIKLRIRQVVATGMLNKFGLNEEQKQEVMSFVFDNAEHLYRLDLRTVLKVAGLRKAAPAHWEDYAFTTVCRKDARFGKLLADKKAAQQEVAA